MNTIYDEVADFLVSGLSPEQLISYTPSEEAQARFEQLIAREKLEGLLPEESAELDRMMEAHRFLMMAKAKAMLKVSQGAYKAA